MGDDVLGKPCGTLHSVWVNCPCMLFGRVWRELKHDGAVGTVLFSLWESATWRGGLVMPDGAHFSEEVVDWVWLPRNDPSLFVPSATPGGKDIVPSDRLDKAVHIDFVTGGDLKRIPLRDRCVHGGCSTCRCLTWHR